MKKYFVVVSPITTTQLWTGCERPDHTKDQMSGPNVCVVMHSIFGHFIYEKLKTLFGDIRRVPSYLSIANRVKSNCLGEVFGAICFREIFEGTPMACGGCERGDDNDSTGPSFQPSSVVAGRPNSGRAPSNPRGIVKEVYCRVPLRNPP